MNNVLRCERRDQPLIPRAREIAEADEETTELMRYAKPWAVFNRPKHQWFGKEMAELGQGNRT